MAAKSNTGLHIALILSVMLAIIGGVFAYIFWDNGRKQKADLESAKSEASSAKTELVKVNQQLGQVKSTLGYGNLAVGNEQTPNTLLGRIRKDIDTVAGGLALQDSIPELQGKDFAKPKLHDTLVAMSEAIRTLERSRKIEQDKTKSAGNKATASISDRDDRVKLYKDRTASIQSKLTSVEKNHQEQLAKMTTSLNQATQKINTLEAEKEKQRQTFQARVDELSEENDFLTKRNDFLTDKIEKIEKVNFDQPDGKVDFVSRRDKVVWINIGSADYLPKRLTFAVYRKNYLGMGEAGTRRDIKGAIEVTRILHTNQAEARIISESLTDPITVGDPIFTPLWTPGRKYKFAFAFKQDVDGDGHSDWEQLKDLVVASNGAVSARLTFDGKLFDKNEKEVPVGEPKREKGVVDVTTKFLVVGEIPNPARLPKPQQPGASRALERFANLKKVARMQGVRIVSLNDFTEWMGFKIDRRVFRPGDQRKWNLKAGAHSTGVNETVGNRTSSGRVSELFNKNGRIGQKTSSGITSGAYGSGNRYGRK